MVEEINWYHCEKCDYSQLKDFEDCPACSNRKIFIFTPEKENCIIDRLPACPCSKCRDKTIC